MDYVRLGALLRKRRLEYRMTQRRLAEMVGIAPWFYGQIERGERPVDLETLVRLAETLRLSIDMLVDLKGRRLYFD